MEQEEPKTTFSGQVIETIAHGSEYVKCAACLNENDLISTNRTGWWDSELSKYVHKDCLSKGQLPR